MMVLGGTTDTSLRGTILATPLLVGYWIVNESSGDFADSSGNGRTGTNNGVAHQGTAGPGSTGNFGTFGSGDYIEVADNDVFTAGTTGLTIFACVNPSTAAPAADMPIACKSGNASNSQREWLFSCFDGSGSTRLFGVKSQATGSTIRGNSMSSGMTTGWQAVAITIPDNSVSSAHHQIFRNGNTDLRNTSSGTGTGSMSNGTGTVRIGQYQFGGGQFTGSIAHLAIYGGILTSTQIGNIMTAADNEGWY